MGEEKVKFVDVKRIFLEKNYKLYFYLFCFYFSIIYYFIIYIILIMYNYI